jgi:3-hydroxyacyl-[acyl-carrier protein] dehydratase/trans-2-decenoyl-[acyl-carrier protein] isomerase
MLTYDEFKARDHFTKGDLLAFAHGRLIKDPPTGFAARLPTPPLLMVDRVVEIRANGARGRLVAEQDIDLAAWYFQCHFASDPVQPGCLGVDAIWQMLGFYCNWRGGLGAGRALGCKEVDFFGQIRPHDAVVTYDIEVRRYSDMPERGASIVLGNGRVLVDGEEIYTVEGARVGLFQGIQYTDYPWPSENAKGGRIER